MPVTFQTGRIAQAYLAQPEALRSNELVKSLTYLVSYSGLTR